MTEKYPPGTRVRFVALAIIAAGVIPMHDGAAAYAIGTDETEFRFASGPVASETFNSQIDDTPFHPAPLHVRDFVVSMPGFPATNNNRNLVDAPPLYLPDFDIGGSTLLNAETFRTNSRFLTFKTPITSFRVYLGNFNDSRVRTSIAVAGTTTELTPGSSTVDVRFFGIASNNVFDTVEFRGPAMTDTASITFRMAVTGRSYRSRLQGYFYSPPWRFFYAGELPGSAITVRIASQRGNNRAEG